MTSTAPLRLYAQYFALFCFSVAIPLVVFGRGAIGAALALSLISVIVANGFKTPWNTIKDISNKHLFLLATIVFIACIPSLFTSVKPDISIKTWAREGALPLALFFVSASLLALKDKLYKLISISLFISATATLILVILNQYAGTSFNDIKLLYKVTNSIKTSSSAFALCLPILFLYALNAQNRKIWTIVSITGSSILLLMLLGQAKAALISSIIIFGTAFFFYSIKHLSRKFLVAFIIGTALISIPVGNWLKAKELTFSSTYSEKGYLPTWIIDLHRQMIWEFSLNKAQNNLTTGVGINASNYIDGAGQSLAEYANIQDPTSAANKTEILPGHPHNWMVEILLETGLVGFIPFLAFVVYSFYLLIRRYFETADLHILAALSIHSAYWIAGLVNFSYWSAWWQASYYVCLFLCLAGYWARLPKQTIKA